MNELNRNRRQFLKAVGVAGAASIIAETAGTRVSLGGEGRGEARDRRRQPVRRRMLRPRAYGPQFYDEVDKRELLEVLESRYPFRWWKPPQGPGVRGGVRRPHRREACPRGDVGDGGPHTAMAALEVGPGDEVILPAWTWYACYDAIVLAGALPVFAEIDDSFGIDPDDLEQRITPRTKASCPPPPGSRGRPGPVLAIARAHKLRVLEDCAQCVGGRYKGRMWARWGTSGSTASSSTRRSPRARAARW